jgi:hypothetical protein
LYLLQSTCFPQEKSTHVASRIGQSNAGPTTGVIWKTPALNHRERRSGPG